MNEKKLLLSKSPESFEKVLLYDDRAATIEMAIDLLQNTSCTELNIYSEQLDELWEDFNAVFKVVEAAGGIVKNTNGDLLFIKRLGKWDLPKGKIEPGESLEQAALREVEEETGLHQLTLKDFVNTTYHIYVEKDGQLILKKTHWFAMDYFGDRTPVPQIEEGIVEVNWKNVDQIKSDVFPMTFRNILLILDNYWTGSK